ncbi:MAG: SH3 domain-containing protein [Bacteroidia bacterium]|nr:SH3 domain-containing protein [Bacteroidia bacterium]
MKNLLLALLVLFCKTPLSAGEWDTDPNLWGIGVVTAGDSANVLSENTPLMLPFSVDFPIYASPNGPVIGTLQTPGEKNYPSGRSFFRHADSNARTLFDLRDGREIAYDAAGLIYYEEKDGFLRVLHHTLQKPAWIKISNLHEYHLKPVLWMDFILQYGPSLFHPHDSIGLNLRKSPSTSGEKITSIKGDLYMVKFTGKREGLWAEVEVTLYDIHPCEGDAQEQNKWSGWIKLMDDKGFPNIWFYTGGC